MTLSPDSPPSSSMDWKFSQVFGERNPGEEVQDADIISAIEFDKTGDYLAVGDRGGRVVIFERDIAKDSLPGEYSQKQLEKLDFVGKKLPPFRYKTEFQSHEPEFDYLKSLEIEEKINKVKWCATPNGSMFILSTNDKTIKLWKVTDHKVKKVKDIKSSQLVSSENALLAEGSFLSGQTPLENGNYLEGTEKTDSTLQSFEDQAKIAGLGDTASARCRKVYAHAHDFNINSISNNSDGETFISSDDLRINLWNLDISNQCFNIIDMKPSNMEDLTEVITSAEFHPFHCNLLAYSSSRGFIRLVDMRQSALCDQSARILQDGESNGSKSFFTEIVASISDIKFASDGRNILSRDYMNLKLWDLCMEKSPVAIYKIHEHLRPKLCDLYTNDSIFDKFSCCISGDGLHFATGSYSNHLRIFSSSGVGGAEGLTLEASKNPSRKSPLQATSRRRSSISNLTRGFYRQAQDSISTGGGEFSSNLKSKLQYVAWHPKANLIACATANSLFLYQA